MSIGICGTQEERQCLGSGCPQCPYKALTTETFACELDDGLEGFYRLMNLWSLVDEKKAAKLDLYISDGWSYNEKDPDIHYYSQEICKSLLEFFEGIDIRLKNTIMDSKGRITAEKADWILSKSVKLVDEYGNGEKKVYTLINNFSLYIWPLKALLSKAVELKRNVEFD